MSPFRLLLLLSFAVLSSSAPAQTSTSTSSDPQYEVPLKTPYRISGTYAELRGNHFHAGLDMGTAGVENVEVYAAEKGWVSRVKVGPYGYGRALYLSHPDGHTTVYGHLNGFAPKIDSLVRRHQYASRTFDTEFFLTEGELPVSRGEFVALSGNTGGSGGPHLHFEVRDSKTEEPLNPLRFITIAPDNILPTIFGVKVYVLSPDAQVSGASADRYLPLANVKGRTIDCVGAIGLGIHCTDYVAAGGRPCGIVAYDLYDGDSLVFSSHVRHFPFDLNRHVNSHIDFAESMNNRRFIQRAFVAPGNRLPIYNKVATPSVIREGEVHKMRFVVRDFAGNQSSVSFTLRGVRNPGAKAKAKPEGELVEWGRTWTKDTLGVDILIPREALYSDSYVKVAKAGSAVSIGNPTIPMQKAMTLTMAVPDKYKSLGRKLFIARVSKSGALTYCGGDIKPDFGSSAVSVISASVLSFGSYTLATDTVAPSLRIRNKKATLSQSELISIGLSDNLSGIDKYSVFIDDQWNVFEYDYKNARLKATPSYLGLAPGRHVLRAEVSDACGNTRSLVWTFNLTK